MSPKGLRNYLPVNRLFTRKPLNESLGEGETFTTYGHITDCKLGSVEHAGVCGYRCGGLACLVWAERSRPNSFWVPSLKALGLPCLKSEYGVVGSEYTAIGVHISNFILCRVQVSLS